MKQKLRTSSARRPQGFTLMEVLMAILILMIVVPALMQAFTICGQIASLSRQRAEALNIAQSTMDELLATQEWMNSLPSGDEKPGPTTYTYQTSMTQWEEADTQLLTVTVNWTSAGQPQEISLETVVYVPDASTSTPGTTTPPTGPGSSLP